MYASYMSPNILSQFVCVTTFFLTFVCVTTHFLTIRTSHLIILTIPMCHLIVNVRSYMSQDRLLDLICQTK